MEWNLKEKNNNWKLIGLTGGIASGKSTVGEIFNSLGAIVLDCDKIYHHCLEAEEGLITRLKQEFGTANRKELSSIVFDHPRLLKELNSITHPFIAKALISRIQQYPLGSIIIIEATLLFESGLGQELPKNIVVTSLNEKRINHLISRNHLSKTEALKRINSQSDDQYRCSFSHLIIENNSTLEDLRQQVTEIWLELTRTT